MHNKKGVFTMQRQHRITTINGIEHLLSKSTLENDKINQVLTDDIVNRVYGSFDYSKFRFIFGNRELRRAKVVKLREAIKRNNRIASYPVIVNSNFQIIDGQHRFIALTELGLEISYVIDDTFDIQGIAKSNTIADKWKANDYLLAYQTLGIVDYGVFANFMKTYDTNFTVTLVLFNGKYSGNLYRDFAEGKFQARNLDRATKWIEMVQDFKKYIQDIHKDRHFVRAIINCFNHPEYNHTRMVKKMKSKGRLMTKSTSRIDYIRQLEAMYNWHVSEDKKVRFF
jgi:hypothetical protein